MSQDKIDKAFLRAAAQHHMSGRLQDAERIYRDILREEPKNADILHLLGMVMGQMGRIEESMKLIKQAISVSPKYADAHYHLGNLFKEKRQFDQAIICFRQALVLNPNFFEAHNNLGTALAQEGQLDQAIASFREAIRVRMNPGHAFSNLLYTLHFHEGYDAQAIGREHRLWGRRADPLKTSWQPHENSRDPMRRVRVGYISPDLRNHVVGRFMAPLLEAHDHEKFEVFCYADVPHPDAMTQQLREHTDQWRFVAGLTDERIAQLIRQDRIDILVDLTMHMEGSRLLVFARKPAPVQVTYLAYCSTTGLDAIDYRLTDTHLEPPDAGPDCYSEASVRLPESYWCYAGDRAAPAVNDLPALSKGEVTFGCLNNFSKVSENALRTWAKILQAVPNSRLLVHAHVGSHRDRASRLLKEMGIAGRRVEFAGFVPTAAYFQLYQKIDIALDPFPYAGGTTTCDALWMGVPVITLAGRTAVGRGGVSILTNVGLPELVARNQDEYVHIASALAGDLPKLAELRAALRDRLQRSPLMDAPRFARHVEAAYRQMWKTWCAKESQNPEQPPQSGLSAQDADSNPPSAPPRAGVS